jgi:hypothetical protein
MAQTPPTPTVLEMKRFLSNADDKELGDEDVDIINEPIVSNAGAFAIQEK